MKKATPNHASVPFWDTEASDAYVWKCYKSYQEKWRKEYSINGHYYGPHEYRYYSSVKYHYTGVKADWELINDLFLEGRSAKVLSCDFAQFADIMINGFQRKWIRYSSLKVPFRHKHDGHGWKGKGKKEISAKEQIRRDWRKKKGRDRDSKKVCWRRGAGKWYKNYSNRLHRSWEKQNISNSNWDDLVNDRKIKFFQDSWMWD